jgi:hypothetical protein
MNFSLYVVFEGSSGCGPVPMCRIADADITREAVSRALDKAEKASTSPLTSALDEEVVHSEILRQKENLRGILSLI